MRRVSFFLTAGAASVIAVALVAQAQTTSSPFAKKKNKPQAWETPNTTPSVPAPRPTTSQPAAASNPTTQAPALAGPDPAFTLRGATAPAGASQYRAPVSTYTADTPVNSDAPITTNPSAVTPQGVYQAPVRSRTQSFDSVPSGQYQSQTAPAPTGPPVEARPYSPNNPTYEQHPEGGYYDYNAPISNTTPTTIQRPPAGYGANSNNPGGYYPGQPQASQSQNKPGNWRDRVGFGNLITSLRGYLKLGGAATERNGWDADFIADGALNGEVGMISQSGIEYGVGLELRGQYDKYRRGFGAKVADCPPTLAGCASTLVAGTPTAIRGHTTQFYTSGADIAKETEFQLEGAYVYLRTAYGDVTIGRDDGSAYLFSLGAPTLLAVGASNSPVDYTGLDAVKTINDASGFAEKITYTSPRLLGDTVGVGVQLGASWAPDAKACGVDYCVRENGKDGTGVLSPDLENVLEVGLALDRRFDNGLSIEGTVTYATASEKSTLAAFDDLSSLGLGLEFGFNDWTLGGSYLKSNNGLADGDYQAWDTGLTWQPGSLGFTLGYGQAEDNNVNLKSQQALFGVNYDIGEYYRIGTGVQHTRRKVVGSVGGIPTMTEQDATALFIEGRIKF